MSDPISATGLNLTTYRASLSQRAPHSPQGPQMNQMARLVARTLASAFHDVPFPVEAPKTARERKLLRLRDEVNQMVLELESAVKEGGLEEVEWPNTAADHSTSRVKGQRTQEEHDDLTLSVRSRQALTTDPLALAAMERSLHPLEDKQAAGRVAWLAKAQVLHHSILAFSAQANVDREMAQRVLDKTEQEASREAFARRVEHLEHLHDHPTVSPHQKPGETARVHAPHEERAHHAVPHPPRAK